MNDLFGILAKCSSIESEGPPNGTDITASQSGSAQQLLVKKETIFISTNAAKLPFKFVRSSDGPKQNLAFPASVNTGWWWSRFDQLIDRQNFIVGWPFRVCIEQQAALDLPHIRLAVCAVQGIVLFEFFLKPI
jgi:hypothetical protein